MISYTETTLPFLTWTPTAFQLQQPEQQVTDIKAWEKHAKAQALFKGST